jgi:hypothetical protein
VTPATMDRSRPSRRARSESARDGHRHTAAHPGQYPAAITNSQGTVHRGDLDRLSHQLRTNKPVYAAFAG